MNFRTGQRLTTLSSKPNSYQSMGDLLISRRKPSILVVDDHPENAMELSELLSPAAIPSSRRRTRPPRKLRYATSPRT